MAGVIQGAGRLSERVAFDDPGETLDESGDPETDAAGNATGSWTERYRCSASIVYAAGSEPVLAERLSGARPSVITVRSCAIVRSVNTAWRIRDVRSGRIFNIRSITPSARRDYIDFVCEDGVAT